MRADFRCQLPCRLLIRRLQRVLGLSHFSLTQHRISESILSADNETNGTSGTKCNFVCNWKSPCSFWWSLFFLPQAFTGLTQRSFQPIAPWRIVIPFTETFPEPSSGFSPSHYSHLPSPETGPQSRLGTKSPQGRNLVRQATRHGLCHLRLWVTLGSWSKVPCETNVNPASWNSPLLGKACHIGFAQHQAARTHTWDMLPWGHKGIPDFQLCGWKPERFSHFWAASCPMMSRKAEWPWKAVAVMPGLVLTTCAIFRKHLCFCFLFPSVQLWLLQLCLCWFTPLKF